jgi:hypothetical protein
MRGAVRAEQIRTLYRQGVGVFAASPINALIVVLVLWRTAPLGPALWWVGAMSAITAGRLVLRQRYLSRSPPPEGAGARTSSPGRR